MLDPGGLVVLEPCADGEPERETAARERVDRGRLLGEQAEADAGLLEAARFDEAGGAAARVRLEGGEVEIVELRAGDRQAFEQLRSRPTASRCSFETPSSARRVATVRRKS